MSTIRSIMKVCDGWDASVLDDAGSARTLHYHSTEPDEATVLADCDRYVAAEAAAIAAEAERVATEAAEIAAKEAKLAQADEAIASAAVAVADAAVAVAVAEAEAADHRTMVDAWKHLDQRQRDEVIRAWPEFEALLKEAAK